MGKIKAHQKPDGTWAECHATVKGCPYGGDEAHQVFNSVKELNDFNKDIVNKKGEASYGILPPTSGVAKKKFKVHKIFDAFARGSNK